MKYTAFFFAGLMLAASPAAADPTNLLVNDQSRLCADAEGGYLQAGTRVILYRCQGSRNQLVSYSSYGEMMIGDKCLDAAGGGGQAGDPIVLWDCHGGPNQRWMGGEDGRIRGINNLCLDVDNGSTHEGAQLMLWRCDASASQLWSME